MATSAGLRRLILQSASAPKMYVLAAVSVKAAAAAFAVAFATAEMEEKPR